MQTKMNPDDPKSEAASSASDRSPYRPRQSLTRWIALALVAITTILYLPALQFDFVN